MWERRRQWAYIYNFLCRQPNWVSAMRGAYVQLKLGPAIAISARERGGSITAWPSQVDRSVNEREKMFWMIIVSVEAILGLKITYCAGATQPGCHPSLKV